MVSIVLLHEGKGSARAFKIGKSMVEWEKQTIVVRNASLKLLVSTKRCFVSVADNVDNSDTIEANHLFEVNITFAVPVDVFE